MEFTPFPKIPRLMRTISISEKIDGTNASIWIGEDNTPHGVVDPTIIARWQPAALSAELVMRCASRSRWIYPGKQSDNAGFAAWVYDHADELMDLGPGHHYGEWWGKGIQRNYGLDEKRFSMFNSRWLDEGPKCVSVVPQLWIGEFNQQDIHAVLSKMVLVGSTAAPGFMNPEGVMIYHHAADQLFKFTLGGDGHKG